MAIRRLSYRLGQEPDTGAVSLVPSDMDSAQLCAHEGKLRGAVTRVIGVPPAGDAGSELSYSLLPDGGRLLCAALPGQRVEALHLSADTPGPGPVWPIDTWRSASWAGEGGESLGPGFVESELPVPEAHFDGGLLVAFARARADRVAPFLADVRRLFEDPAGRQIVLVEDDSGTVAHWIALACASLPEAYVSALTFTTWTGDPRRAPHRIIGIGPDAEFDRSDDAVVEYLYRVHDGTGGGPESPPTEPDAWARLTAERWLTGNPPRPPRGTVTGPEGPFALIPLVAGVLTGAAGGGGEGAVGGARRAGGAGSAGCVEVSGGAGGAEAPASAGNPANAGAPATAHHAELAGLHGITGDTLRSVLDAFAQSVARGEADARTLGELDRLCRGLDGEQALAARPLALALVKQRLDASRGSGTLPDLAAFEGLPLGQEAWRELREEYGDRADDALRARLHGPVTTWTEPLRLALAVGADGGPGLAEAMDRLADALLHPERRDCAQAVQVLSELDHLAFTRRVLRLLLVGFTERKLDRLRALADSPQGDWLRRNIDDAPLTVRLAAAAAQWSGPPDRLRGVELFERLTGLLSNRRVEDVKTLNLLWRMVWRNDPPDRAEQPRVARACTPRLIIEADLGRRIMGWLKEPDHCDRELVDFAREMYRDPKLGAQDRDAAELLVIAQDLADGRIAVSRASVARLRELGRKVSPLGMVLRKGIDERVGRALAGTNPLDVCESHCLQILVAAGPDLLGAYRAHLLEEGTRDRLDRELPGNPAELAAYFHVWRPRRRHGVTTDWRDVAAELLDQVLAPVLAHLDDHRLGQIATVLQREGQGVQEWTAWRHRVAQEQS
ncbi:GTPase-associated protein 1-related protein [Streptomyces sp. Je 1-369]|uniref:GTPase-associated protein 1-related protein n=1 Tax=Streptomyces sp. Je 1-369 TaxID=2966192 RepID=UPI002286A2D3|nr:GTPase-associated protein 1-related protein [Streptomyces sp. Je 1-369]WAL98535.1 GTPase-associated protein 1-related protein [Streptomyces sp. Je 1-369]